MEVFSLLGKWGGVATGGLLFLAACGHPEQKFAVTVTDESGKPMAGVECATGFYRPKRSDGPGLDSYVVRETTNAQGKAALLGETVYFNTTVVAKRSGFYDCRVDRMWITGRAGKRWEPWPVELKLVMKKIRNPHPCMWGNMTTRNGGISPTKCGGMAVRSQR